VNLFSMLGLLFFIFGILGVTMFGPLCVVGDSSLPAMKGVRCMFVDDENTFAAQANFKNIGWSLMTLLRVTTGDDWGAILASSQLGPGSRKVDDFLWSSVGDMLGTDPASLPNNHSDFISRDGENTNFEIAALAVRHWNATVAGMDLDPDWPFPDGFPEARKWIVVARQALPGCITQEEAIEFQKRGLADCSTGGYDLTCEGTCGDWLIANIYYMIFFAIASFVLLQLVIAVLMEQLSIADDAESPLNLVPGCTHLSKPVLGRIYRRWRFCAKKNFLLMGRAKSAQFTARGQSQHASSAPSPAAS